MQACIPKDGRQNQTPWLQPAEQAKVMTGKLLVYEYALIVKLSTKHLEKGKNGKQCLKHVSVYQKTW